MTPREAFKFGFLHRCTCDGIPLEKAAASVKTATGFFGSIVDAGKSIGSGVAGYAIPTALVAPPILGGLAGYGAARLTDVDDNDVKDIQDRELIDSYRREAARLQRQKTIKDYAKFRKRTGRIFM